MNGLHGAGEFELGQHDNAVALVQAGVADDDEAVDVRHGQQAQAVLLIGVLAVRCAQRVAVRRVKGRDLHRVGDDVAV